MTDQVDGPSSPNTELFAHSRWEAGPISVLAALSGTLENSAAFDICPECGWEDDGQDNPYAGEVWGGPNGRLNLTQARAEYAAFAAGPPRPDSVVHGGEGAWWCPGKRYREQTGQLKANEASESDTNR